MSAVLYYLFIKPLSLLPLSFLYVLSDFLYFVLYRIVKYRRDVIRNNITKAFPNKDAEEVNRIEKSFYKHFCDLIIEAVKGFSISKKELDKRVKVNENKALTEFYKSGQDVIAVASHYANWEMIATACGFLVDHNLLGAYKPLKDKFYDNKVRQSRSKHGTVMFPMKETKDFLEKDFGKPKILCLISDQSPTSGKRCLWTLFMNQETGVIFGPEKLAKEYDLPVFYSSFRKVKRGYYEVTNELITAKPQETAYGEITLAHVKLLENDIKACPDYWLWSHKRWKKDRPEGFELITEPRDEVL